MCDQCVALQDRITVLEYRIADLTGGDLGPIRGVTLPASQLKMLNYIAITPGIIPRNSLFAALFPDPYEAPRTTKLIDVQMCKLRVAIAPLGIEIKTQIGMGWYMPDESRAKVRALREAKCLADAA